MGWTLFWVLCLAGGTWGTLIVLADNIEKNMCEPLYDRIAEEGRKTIWQFLLYSTFFSCLLRFLTRLPVWIAAYYVIQYVGYSSDAALKACIVFIFATGFSRAAELVRNFYPPKKEHDVLTKYFHKK